MRLVSLSRQNHADRLHNQLEVGPNATLLDVQKVKRNPLIEADVITVATRLPIASNSRLDEQTLPLIRGVLADLARKCRPWTNDGHVPKQDVEELRKLVQTGLADEATDAGNTRVGLDLEGRPILLV